MQRRVDIVADVIGQVVQVIECRDCGRPRQRGVTRLEEREIVRFMDGYRCLVLDGNLLWCSILFIDYTFIITSLDYYIYIYQTFS